MFVNLDESFVNRLFIKSLYGEWRKVEFENSNEGFIGRFGWV